MGILCLNELNSFLKYYNDNEIFFVLHKGIDDTKYHALLLVEIKEISGIFNYKFQDFSNGKIINDYGDTDNPDTGNKFQNQDYFIDGYQIKNRISLRNAVLMTGYRQKEKYSYNDVRILIANYNQTCKPNKGIQKVYK